MGSLPSRYASPWWATDVRVVKFLRESGPLGLRLKSEEGIPGVFVMEKLPGSQADGEPRIRVGDFLLKVGCSDRTS
jgi:hypothetical protein